MTKQHITVTSTSGETTQVTTTDPDTARQYEELPFESNDVAIVSVVVTGNGEV